VSYVLSDTLLKDPTVVSEFDTCDDRLTRDPVSKIFLTVDQISVSC